MESYSSGRRGVPAKDVGVPAREGSNPSLSATMYPTEHLSLVGYFYNFLILFGVFISEQAIFY